MQLRFGLNCGGTRIYYYILLKKTEKTLDLELTRSGRINLKEIKTSYAIKLS